jgi:hypothetical protein
MYKITKMRKGCEEKRIDGKKNKVGKGYGERRLIK